MLRVDLQGTKREVRSFLYELSRAPQFHVVAEREKELAEWEMRWSGEIEHQPCERIKAVCLHTPKKDIYLPIFDLLHIEIKPGVHILVGSVFDS
jgi:hypothetical protein